VAAQRLAVPVDDHGERPVVARARERHEPLVGFVREHGGAGEAGEAELTVALHDATETRPAPVASSMGPWSHLRWDVPE
jgi:hypothetical protein